MAIATPNVPRNTVYQYCGQVANSKDTCLVTDLATDLCCNPWRCPPRAPQTYPSGFQYLLLTMSFTLAPNQLRNTGNRNW